MLSSMQPIVEPRGRSAYKGNFTGRSVYFFRKAALTALLIPLDFLCDGCHAYFTGFTRVPAAEVAIAYLRAISTPITGRILKLHKTDS